MSVKCGAAVKVVVAATPHNPLRMGELADAMEALGVKDFSVLYQGLDGRLDTIPMMEIVSEFDKAQSEFKPDLMLIPAPSHHQDHKVVFEAGFASARQSVNPGKFFVPMVAQYEYPPLEWSVDPFAPNWWLDISEVIEEKVASFAAYKSQTYPEGWANGEGIRAFAKSVGTYANMRFAERFRILRMVNKLVGGKGK